MTLFGVRSHKLSTGYFNYSVRYSRVIELPSNKSRTLRAKETHHRKRQRRERNRNCVRDRLGNCPQYLHRSTYDDSLIQRLKEWSLTFAQI